MTSIGASISELTSLLLTRRSWVPVIFAIGLIAASRYSFLLFHTLAELFAIGVAVILFVVAWHTYSITRNHFLMYLGCGYFWVACFDTVHTIVYKGVQILPGASVNLSAQLWIAGRYVEAALLLSAPLFLLHPLRRSLAFAGYGLMAVTLTALIFAGLFPDAFIEGRGLTQFKIISEYLIIAILIGAVVVLVRRRSDLDVRVLGLMIASIIFTIGAEIAFTFYVSVYGLSNLIGHIFKLFSYWLIFEAIVRTALTEPYRVMSRQAGAYNAIPLPLIVTNSEGMIRQVNEFASELVDIPPGQLIGQHCHTLFHAAEIEAEDCQVCHCVQSGTPASMIPIHVSRKDQHWEFSISPIDENMGAKSIIQVANNVTERKIAEAALIDSEKRFRVITDTAPGGISITKIESGEIRFCNQGLGDIFGIPSQQLIGRSIVDFYRNPGVRDRLVETIIENSGIRSHEVEMIDKNGQSVWVLMSATPIKFGGEDVTLSILIDVSDRREAERRLMQTTKLATLGEMATGIAHELNQPLSIIRMITENILLGLEDGSYAIEKVGQKLMTVTAQVDRMAEISNHMRLFSRKDKAVNAFRPQNCVANAVRMIGEQLRVRDIEISVDISPIRQAVYGYPLQLEQVVLNLIANARDAVTNRAGDPVARQAGFTPKIEVTMQESLDESIVTITVADNGGGIPDEIMDQIFDPFYTTKPEGQGTGLGLSIGANIINNLDGRLEVVNTDGGCRFDITLPGFTELFVHDEPLIQLVAPKSEGAPVSETPETAPKPPPAKSVSARILIADDESLAAESISEYLRKKGFSVITAQDGAVALEMFRGQQVDAIITDLRMPVMDGNELIREVRRDGSDIPIIVTTGHTNVGEEEETVAVGASAVLKKPIRLRELNKLLISLTDA